MVHDEDLDVDIELFREVCGQPSMVFQLLQLSILPLGYQLTESAGKHVGSVLAESIRWFSRMNQNVKTMRKQRNASRDVD